jgi:formylglycine-generating enzyme required for sulfatase activity
MVERLHRESLSQSNAVVEGENQLKSKAKVFISYARKDIAFADGLDAALKARGFEPLIDRTDIYAFEEWWKRVETLIVSADTVVFVLSPDAVRPGSVARKEVDFAASLNKRFAPVVFRPVEDSSVPEPLAKLNFIFFDDATRFEENADQLAEGLNTDIGWIRQHTELGEQARRWARAKGASGLLLRSPVLEEAERWIAARPRGAPAPTEDMQAFIQQSRQGARAAQRLRRLVTASISTLLVGIVLGLVVWINQPYLQEQILWYWAMHPYQRENFYPYVLKPEKEWVLKQGDAFKECLRGCPEMVVVPAGEFMMGSPTAEKDRNNDESPRHKITIARPFAVSRFDVTFADWDACVSVGTCARRDEGGPDTILGRPDKQPFTYVSWRDAAAYAGWLSTMTEKTYRLLTEAEWEYAARAGTTTAYYWGDKIGMWKANCNGCRSKWDNMPSPVGSFPPNRFDLYDMAGNVWQWVQDCYHENYNGAPTDGSAWIGGYCAYHVVRGGSWLSAPRDLRSASRRQLSPGGRDFGVGFRVGRTLSVH